MICDILPGLRPSFQSTSISAQLKETLGNHGLCVLPYFIAEQFPQLEMVLSEEVVLKRDYWLTCHNHVARTPRVHSLMNFFSATMRTNVAYFNHIFAEL